MIITGITEEPAVCEATTPTNLSISSINATSATVNYDAVTGATYDVRYRESGASSWIVQSTSGTSVNLTNLTAETSYEVQVRSKCDTSTSNYSSTESFTTTNTQLSYCASQGNNVNDEYIGRVQIGTIDNSSGSGNGYSDFTNLSTGLDKDASATITITPTWTGTQYNEGYSVWVDYNQNGDFTDAGEQVFTQTATQTSPVSGSFTVPTSALEGSTRMRVSMKYNGVATSCESFSYGEVEDYTIIINASASVSYCSSGGNDSSYEWIDNVSLNGMSNSTGDDGGYADYTSRVANLSYGENTIQFSAGFASSSYTEYWKIWVDYNKNGTFESSELMVSGSSSSSNNLSASFTVPTSALTGTTRMRVSMKYNSEQTACESFSYGEVEDYTVNIGQSVTSMTAYDAVGEQLGNAEASFEASLYPNPVSGSRLNVRMNDARETTYQVFDMMGKKVLQGDLSASNAINVYGLSSGVYMLKLNDGQKDIVKKFIKQ